MTNEHREDGALGCFESAREVSPDFVTNEPRGESLAGVAQDTLQKFNAFGRAKGFVQPYAVGNAPSRGTMDRFEGHRQLGICRLTESEIG